ncbi:hydrogenase formation protein HypD [Geobacter sp. DSM 9736]|uniref:hydrogenase formation protein HypD n=1 Tax=Geobacter sp. DSM 9736 TaxID=1277350 RepID=UPI000B50DB76|nr:hydrogenase formation protein HypD [Geobacter sp. DSM 9736]SNB47089.1 Hydrogenase maturation protein HypD [Geobacter sp. DSM 9736]
MSAPLAGFSDGAAVAGVASRLQRLLSGSAKSLTFMEVCGTHTMAIGRFGLRTLLPPQVRLVSGPGCPVCVTHIGYVDRAIACSRLPGTIIASFGDMLRVPGSISSLLEERARGADVRVVYSPLDAVALARRHPEHRVVFLGVGFETTAPTVAASIIEADRLGLGNYAVLASHKTIPGPMEILASDTELAINGYICPAHVSAIIGADAFIPLARKGIPCVVTGFEPLDIMLGVEMLARQVLDGRAEVEIQYSRVVRRQGNRKARDVISKVFTPCDAAWRGIGSIPGSGLAIRDCYRRYDAERTVPVEVGEPQEPQGCLCGEILKGKASPRECPLFGIACTPEAPVGACMVSSEGSCAAAYKYGG